MAKSKKAMIYIIYGNDQLYIGKSKKLRARIPKSLACRPWSQMVLLPKAANAVSCTEGGLLEALLIQAAAKRVRRTRDSSFRIKNRHYRKSLGQWAKHDNNKSRALANKILADVFPVLHEARAANSNPADIAKNDNLKFKYVDATKAKKR